MRKGKQFEKKLFHDSNLKITFGWLVVGFMADCLTRDLDQWVGWPPWGSFQGILARIYASFGENNGKLRTARSTNATGDWTWHLPLPVCERSYWWSQGRTARHPCLIWDSNPEPQVQQPASLTIETFGRQITFVS